MQRGWRRGLSWGACQHRYRTSTSLAMSLIPSPPAGMHFFLLVAVRSSVLWRHRVNRE